MKKLFILFFAMLSMYMVHAQKVGINTPTPDSTLTVNGSAHITGNTKIANLQITNGAGANKILQSDANGNASWVTPGAGGSGFTHYIGELYQGGIVVAVWKIAGVEHGLIASLTDVGASTAWSNVTTTFIGTAESPIDGQANTTAIVGQAGNSSGAAKLCDDYVSGGYSDWYLPASWELNLCYNAAFIVNTVLGATNGFQFDYYWSSTEYDNNYAWQQYFANGYPDFFVKGNVFNVRAVRRF